MAKQVFRPVTINFATQRVPGDAAGVPLLALVIVIAIVLPEARWLLVSGVAFGAVAGAAMIYLRRRNRHDSGSGHPTLLDPHAPENRRSHEAAHIRRPIPGDPADPRDSGDLAHRRGLAEMGALARP